MLNFEVRDIMKSLDERDYEYLSKNKGANRVAESKLWGTSKTSYQDMGEAKIIVKHNRPVNGDFAAGRSQHIDSIYIESSQGERFKYPYKHLNGARAMARHVANGGNPYDSIGVHVIGLSEELSKLKMFKGYVDRNPVVSEAMDSIRPKVVERMDQIKKDIHKLQSQAGYNVFVESFEEQQPNDIPEEIMNDWIDRLTIRTFNEDLKNVFPYIYKLVDETSLPVKELTIEDLVDNSYKSVYNDVPSELEEMSVYESVLDSIVNEENTLFKGGQSEEEGIAILNDLLANGITVKDRMAIMDLIDDPQLSDVFDEMDDLDPDMEIDGILKDYIKIYDEDNGTNLMDKIQWPDSQEEQPEEMPQEEPPATTEPVQDVQPAAPNETEQPVADSIQYESHPFAKAVHKAKKAGMKLEDTMTVGNKEITLKDAILMAGMKVEEFFDSETLDKQKIAEYVKSMYNSESGDFPKGETGVILAVEKQFGESAVGIAQHTIKELRQVFEQNRLKKLAGIS